MNLKDLLRKRFIYSIIKIDVKNVKSKVECWGQDGTSKKNKKSEEIVNNFELMEDSRIPNDFLSDLYNIYSNIETHFSSKIKYLLRSRYVL
jgi:hypothetical protein